jgi:hypothetical protein
LTAIEHRRADRPLDAAESLDLVDCQVEARHLEVFRPNTFTDVVHHSHGLIVAPVGAIEQRTVSHRYVVN